MKFTITGPTFSTNQMIRLGRTWRSRAAIIKRMRRQLGWQIVAAAIDAGNPLPPVIMGPPPFRMHVRITICRGRRFDPDNVLGGTVKLLLDAMRDLQLIRNDSPKWLDLEVDQRLEKDKNAERAEVELTPAKS